MDMDLEDIIVRGIEKICEGQSISMITFLAYEKLQIYMSENANHKNGYPMNV